jgi:hypothetical protein
MARRQQGDGSPPIWPSLDEQIVEAGAPPGSALAKLIADNQDFTGLHYEEARDKMRLPPWLRVHWRKNHPEYQYIPGDPTSGYPLALRDIYIWMKLHPDLKPDIDKPGSTSE